MRLQQVCSTGGTGGGISAQRKAPVQAAGVAPFGALWAAHQGEPDQAHAFPNGPWARLTALDAWIDTPRERRLSRPEPIRRLVELGLPRPNLG
jgi:hypothetical protein